MLSYCKITGTICWLGIDCWAAEFLNREVLNKVQTLKALNKKNCHWSLYEKIVVGGEWFYLQLLCKHKNTELSPLSPSNPRLSDIFPSLLSKLLIGEYYSPLVQYTQSVSWEGKSLKDKKGKFALRNSSRQENCQDTGRSQDFSPPQMQFGLAVFSDMNKILGELSWVTSAI